MYDYSATTIWTNELQLFTNCMGGLQSNFFVTRDHRKIIERMLSNLNLKMMALSDILSKVKLEWLEARRMHLFLIFKYSQNIPLSKCSHLLFSSKNI